MIFLSLKLPAQTIKLLENEKTWTVEYADRISLPPDIRQLTYAYAGDTVIAAATYGLFGNGAILQEDTINRKVYAYDEYSLDARECLLYDFAARTGDTLTLCHGLQIVIDSVSQIVLNNGKERKIFYYTGGINGAYYIEGIGSNLGLLELSEAIGPPSLELMCVRTNGVELYGNRCREVVSSVFEASLQRPVPSLYPNPATDQVVIDSSVPVGYVQLIDLWGRIVMQARPRANTLQLDNVKRGWYLLILYDQRGYRIGMEKILIFQ